MTAAFDDLIGVGREGGRMQSPHWLQTYSGVRFDLGYPHPDDVRVEDLVHALANVNRFTGHARKPYSVAEHSVRVAQLVSPAHRKAALLHDATEAYCNDLAAPMKRMREMAGYKEIEQRVWLAICARFGLDAELPAEVKRADLVMLGVEKRVLTGSPPQDWELPVSEEEVDAAAATLTEIKLPLAWGYLRDTIGWDWLAAKSIFARRLDSAGIR